MVEVKSVAVKPPAAGFGIKVKFGGGDEPDHASSCMVRTQRMLDQTVKSHAKCLQNPNSCKEMRDKSYADYHQALKYCLKNPPKDSEVNEYISKTHAAGATYGMMFTRDYD